jgi:2-desacetyl-2-hydroxyethyl bacteriochlorophyllide A dehydrogenase
MRRTLYFDAPYTTSVRDEPLPDLPPQSVRVQTQLSAISAGTELLFYRGRVPAGMAVDATISGMDAAVIYPLSYGYAALGIVDAVGAEVDPNWLGRRVFGFNPHTSAFVADPSQLISIPAGIADEQAVLLPNVETAVNFVQDARPLLGERAVIFGMGVVGLLTLRILAQFPLAEIVVVDGIAARRELALKWGAQRALTPEAAAEARLDPDLILEVSSSPAALATAVRMAGYGTRIVVGSWYGDKDAVLPLGGTFHRNRVTITSSQVSTIGSALVDRWTKARRFDLAWSLLRSLPAADLISHCLPIEAASTAYAILDRGDGAGLQILFTYSPSGA